MKKYLIGLLIGTLYSPMALTTVLPYHVMGKVAGNTDCATRTAGTYCRVIIDVNGLKQVGVTEAPVDRGQRLYLECVRKNGFPHCRDVWTKTVGEDYLATRTEVGL